MGYERGEEGKTGTWKTVGFMSVGLQGTAPVHGSGQMNEMSDKLV